MPSPVGLAPEKVLERELGFAGRKRSRAGWALYGGLVFILWRLRFYYLIKRTALRADEVDLRSLDERTLSGPRRHEMAAVHGEFHLNQKAPGNRRWPSCDSLLWS
jgi:hypothetical protein